jgi:hypothetical protein
VEGHSSGAAWDSDAQIDRSIYPKTGRVIFVHGKYEKYDLTREHATESAQDDYENNVYPSQID